MPMYKVLLHGIHNKNEVQKHLLVRGFDESFINARGDGEPSADEKDCN